jgi:cytochrome c553
MRFYRICLLLTALGFFSTIGVPSSNAEPDLERGRAVAMGAGTTTNSRSACHTCHGMHGAGDSSGAFPRLSGQAAWYLYKQLKDYASGERQNDVMSPVAKALTDQQMEDVAAFYAAQQVPAEAPRAEPDSLLLQRGAAISARGLPDRGVAACVNCHGPSGRGLPPSFPYLAGQYAPYVELQFRFWKQGMRHNDPLGVMQHIAQQLSEDDVKAVAAYFASMPPPTPRQQERAQE